MRIALNWLTKRPKWVGSMAGACLVNYYKFNLDMPSDECQQEGEWIEWIRDKWMLAAASWWIAKIKTPNDSLQTEKDCQALQ